MWHNDDPGTERLRGDLRDYYGTAMFNGNPMAMMELEEVERASRSELDDIARRNGFDPSDYSATYDSPYDYPGYSSRSSGNGGGYDRGYGGASSSSGISVSVSTRYETISESTRTFFEPNGTDSDTGFFANYARRLKDEL